MIFKLGQKVCLKLPSFWPKWTLNQHQDGWREELSKLNNQFLTINHLSYSMLPGMDDFQWFAGVEESDYIILVDWLDTKIICDCPIKTVLIRGCQNSNHI